MMQKLVVDDDLRSKLNDLQGELEFCDASGRTLGHFVPTDLYREMLVAWSEGHISEEELNRRMNEPGGRSLHEIWQRLGRK
jgi:hypothetical protein